MPIVDYVRSAETAYQSILDDPSISRKNKEHAERFDKVYRRHVKPATRAKFWRHIVFFLRKADDVTTLFDDRDKVNDLFARFHRDLSPGYYATLINCTNRFVRWLNDDIKPKGFKDIKSPKKSLQRRKLTKNDMWEWEDGLKVSEQTRSAQTKAMVMTQLNLGARPSEFIDLRYGDIESKGEFMIIHIRDGKTGGRDAILYHAVPYLARWMNEHPSKERDAPLWVVENAKNSHSKRGDGSYRQGKNGQVIPANYRTLKKRMDQMTEKAGLRKKSDFYTLRHSCARLLRLWGVPVEECAKQLGHSVKEFTETYGRLDTADREARHARAFGIEVDEQGVELPKPQKCAKCSMINEAGIDYCSRCGAALNVKVALDRMAQQDEAFEEFVMSKLNAIAEKHGLQIKK